jgi:CRP-like cAMP-binding protein
MKDNPQILYSIFKEMEFSEEESVFITSLFHKETALKGDILIKAGEYAQTQYYIFEGCLRAYHIDLHGKEHTVQFGIADWWISDYTSFFSKNKSIMTIEVIQDAILYKISKYDKEKLCETIPKVERFFRIKLERAFASFQNRILSNLSQTASERYLSFIKTYPNIEKSVKNYHIASYLGITTESLSRIRRDLHAQ